MAAAFAMTSALHNHRGPRHGAAIVELTIVLTLLLVIVFGCVDLGRFAMTLIAVNNAAREGATFGSTHPFTASTQELWKHRVRTAVSDEMTAGQYTPDKLSVGEPIVLADGDLRRVRVSVDHTFETIVPWPLLPSELKITRHAEMPIVR